MSPVLASPQGDGSDTVAIRLRDVTKSFPGVSALRGVDLDLYRGEIHGLVGENGAGKSTLIKHMTGVYTPDVGTIEILGHRIDHSDPRAYQRAGVAAIYQESVIVPQLSASANVFLGRPITRGPFLSTRLARERFIELSKRLGADIRPDRPAGALSVANQQLLEIMRVLESEHQILIMDEPTASLGPAERRRLYEIVKGLRNDGLGIAYISHDLDEVLALCDRVSVMRDGQLIATKPVTEWSKEDLVKGMLGGAVLTASTKRTSPPSSEALRVEGLSIPGVVDDLTFAVGKGEIFAIAGLIGSGRTEILRAIAGADPSLRGRLFVDGHECSWPRSVTTALRYGIALSPEDRKEQGLVLGLSGAANVTLSDPSTTAVGPFVSVRRRLRRASNIVRGLAFDVGRLNAPAGTLSGGNQQKLVIAKWLHREPSILLLDEPTRGIDVGAKAEMFHVIRGLADKGMTILFVSSELEEVVDVADRALVLKGGQGIATLSREELSVEAILHLLFDT